MSIREQEYIKFNNEKGKREFPKKNNILSRDQCGMGCSGLQSNLLNKQKIRDRKKGKDRVIPNSHHTHTKSNVVFSLLHAYFYKYKYLMHLHSFSFPLSLFFLIILTHG